MKLFFSVMLLIFTLQLQARSIKFMQYNVENFFDTTHDESTEDYTYLPQATKKQIPGFTEICKKLSSEYYINQCLNLDWNENKFTKKILSISKVIKSYDHSGKGPDILVLMEIENKNSMSKLISKGLSGMGYQYSVLIEGDDSRGIDNAVVSRFPIIKAVRHPTFVNGVKLDTRGILEVVLSIDDQEVVVYANHWPSQNNPTEHRVESAKLLNFLAQKQRADLIIALGDFNTTAQDAPAPFSFMPDFIDAEPLARRVQPGLHPGSYFYRGNWGSLDHIFIHKSSALTPLYEKFQIMNRNFMLIHDSRSGQMIPNRFNFDTTEGFSDHLPLGMEFSI